jgi:glycosyltransferase involved in cell wall biosynthesis
MPVDGRDNVGARHRPLRALFLTKYGRRAASTRHRYLQFFPFLEQSGIECVTSELFDDRYLARLFDEDRLDLASVTRGYARRIGELRRVGRFDLVVLYKEAAPYLPATFERLLGRLRVPYVYDFDDAVFQQYEGNRHWIVRTLFGRKMHTVIERSALVFAGNEHLARFARRFNSRVEVVPTVVDTSVFVPVSAPRAGAPVVIGWLGSPTTASYLTLLQDVWRQIAAAGCGACRLRLVGAGPVGPAIAGAMPPTGAAEIAVDLRRWSERAEVAELQGFDIGIMPLTDDEWARGKCGFKLIQYMACGLPVVASPVGVNAEIVRDGQTGFLCRTPEEWAARLRTLAADPAMRRRMGQAGRALAQERWSLESWAPTVARLLREVGERSPGDIRR